MRFDMRLAIAFTGLLMSLALGGAIARDAAVIDVGSKAACVRDGLVKVSGEIYGPRPVFPANPTAADIAVAKDRMERFDTASRAVLRSCLSEIDVRELGFFSFLEDVAGQCPVRRSKAAGTGRVGGVDVDIVNAASLWEGHNTPVDERVFFRAQAAARSAIKTFPPHQQATAVCEALFSGYGPKGDRIPGLIERDKR